jgi:hypothetical protein
MASRNRGMAAPDRRRAKIWPTIQALASAWDSPRSPSTALTTCTASGSSTGQNSAPVSSAARAKGGVPATIALCPPRTLARTNGTIGPKCPAAGMDENRIRIARG